MRGVAILLCLLPLVAQADDWNSAVVHDAVGPIGPNHPLPAADANNAAFHDAKVLTPSGTAGTAGTVAGAAASASNTGYSFGWVCTTAGLGSITLTSGAVVPYYFFANSGGVTRDGYAIEDAEPGTGSGAAAGCTFWVLR